MTRLPKMIGLLAMLSLGSIVSCTSKPDLSVPSSDATVQCEADCVSVSKAFVKEHSNLFNEVIRLRAALEMCREKP
jgi:hypothetical protein